MTTTTLNVNGNQSCAACEDTGWVLLVGTTRVGQHLAYERGAAACRWCERGAQAFKANPTSLSTYQATEMEPPAGEGRRIWPSEYAATPEGKADPHTPIMLAMLTGKNPTRTTA